MIKRNIVHDAVAISEASQIRAMDREISGAKLVNRPSSTTMTSKKQRVEFEPFHLVYCDAYEDMDKINTHNTGHRYVLRFVDHATGYKKDYSTQTKDQFSDAFAMFLAWIRCVAPIIEKHRNLPPGHPIEIPILPLYTVVLEPNSTISLSRRLYTDILRTPRTRKQPGLLNLLSVQAPSK